jgi:predicted permease
MHALMSVFRLPVQDAIRGLRSDRRTSLLATAVLSIAMAASVVTFSVVDAIAIRPLPYGSPDRLVGLMTPAAPPAGASSSGRAIAPTGALPSAQHYFGWAERARAFQALGASAGSGVMALRAGGRVIGIRPRRITANLFDVLGVRPVAGQFFAPEHERPGGPRGVILSEAAWRGYFGADPAVVGGTISLNEEPWRVVGVLPDGVTYPITSGTPPDLYIPWVPTAAERSPDARPTGSLSVVGRLKPGVSVSQARADVQRLSPALVFPLLEQVAGPARPWLLLVLTAAGFVLLLACVNVASLLLARAATRGVEISTRYALGASRGRVASAFILEGLLLSLAAVATALLLSYWALDVVAANLPPGLPRADTIAVNGRVFAAAAMAAIACGVVCATAPIWLARSTPVVDVLKAGGTAVLGGTRRNRVLAGLLAGDVALVTVLLVAATLVVSTFVFLTRKDLGFDRQNVATIYILQPLGDVQPADQFAAGAAVSADLIDRASSVPGVSDAAIVVGNSVLDLNELRESLDIPGYETSSVADRFYRRHVSKDYFRTMGIGLVRGRLFESSDGPGSQPVMLLNETAARRFFAGRDPLGVEALYRGARRTIIGIVQDLHAHGPEAETAPEMYFPLLQDDVFSPFGRVNGWLVVRTSGNSGTVAAAVFDAIRPGLRNAPREPVLLEDAFRELTVQRRFNASVMTAFGLVAAAIAIIGVYGTASFFVARQVRTIGLRMALGASRSAVAVAVLRSVLLPVGLGTTVGLALTWLASNGLEPLVYGVRPVELPLYAAVGGGMVLLGLCAALVPALRATRVDPLTALRAE